MRPGRFITSGLIVSSSETLDIRIPEATLVTLFLFNWGTDHVPVYLSKNCQHSGVVVSPMSGLSLEINSINSLRFSPNNGDSSESLNISYTVVSR